MMQIVNDFTHMDVAALDSFVEKHPNGNFFQSGKALEFFRSVPKHQPVVIVALDNNEVIGSLLSVIIRDWSSIKGYFTRRCITWGGPLVKEGKEEAILPIIREFDKVMATRAIYSELRNMFEMSAFSDALSSCGWNYEEHLNIVIDLTKSEKDLWNDVHSKRKNGIRKGEKEGTRVELVTNKVELGQTYEILRQVYRRAKLPLPEFEFFETAYDLLSPDYFKPFAALNDGKIIGTTYAITFGDTIYDWYAGGRSDYYDKRPNDVMPWQVFLWGKKEGYRMFDFGGAGKPDVAYGVRDYKKKFGGQVVNYGRFEKIHKPLLYRTVKAGFNVYQRIIP